MVRLVLGMVLSLLPNPYRGWWAGASAADFRRATILSGLVEALGCVGLYILRYFYFIQYRVGSIADAAVRRAGGEDALAVSAAQYGIGFVSLVEYILSPLSLLLVYFTLEGTLRVFAATVTEETPGTLPLYLLAWTIERTRRWHAERALGPRIVDEVHRFQGIRYDLGIASCRPKRSWDRLMTIEFEEKLYEVFEEKLGPPPRRYIYLLREIPKGKVIRGLHRYRPDEALDKTKK